MVCCRKCGTENEDDAKFCIQCRAPLYEEGTEEVCVGPRGRERVEERFGQPCRGANVGIVFGLLPPPDGNYS